jgi:hypothetical protein
VRAIFRAGFSVFFFSNERPITDNTTVRLKVEENQLVDVFGEIGFHVDGLKGA